MFEKNLKKITYKTYFNDRLKQVLFHRTPTYPLYIQVTYDRKSIFFKSYYFDLLAKPRFRLRIPGLTDKMPTVEHCIEQEHKVIEYIIQKHRDDFSLDLFKEEYDIVSTDLIAELEPLFFKYMYTFFWDDGYPGLGDLSFYGSRDVVAYDAVRSMRRAFKPELYKKFKDNSLYYAPPYLPLYEYMDEIKHWPLKILTVMDLQLEGSVEALKKHLLRQYSEKDTIEIMDQVSKWHTYI